MPLTRLPLGTAVSGNLPAANYKAGTVLQVKNSIAITSTSITSTSFTDVTDANITITPTSSSSKILVVCQAHVYVNAQSNNAWRGGLFRLLRGTTSIYQDPSGGYGTAAVLEDDGDRYMVYQTHTYLDSPATTSATTYKYQYASKVSGSNITINHPSYGEGGGFTVYEIAQ